MFTLCSYCVEDKEDTYICVHQLYSTESCSFCGWCDAALHMNIFSLLYTNNLQTLICAQIYDQKQKVLIIMSSDLVSCFRRGVFLYSQMLIPSKK
jgi:hypothetical protein